MQKPWNKSTVDEKLEALREDIRKICDAHNQLGNDVVRDRWRLYELEKLLRDDSKKVA